MKRRALALGFVVASSLLAGCALFQAATRPADEIVVQRTPERVARGAYLVKHVGVCFACHSPLDKATHMPLAGQMGAGGRRFGREEGLPGNLYATNLTPDPETGLGNWTDGEIIRAVREGVSKDGHALFPLMPYPNYRQMSDADVQDIVAYLRTIPAVKNPVPKRELDFPVNLIVNTIPKPLTAAVPPAPSPQGDPVARGKYVAAMASCMECHTPQTPRGPDKARFMAGGFPFVSEGHTVWMPNITPDKETGVGSWTDAQIASAIRFGQRPDGRQLSPVMPWPFYNGMAPEDAAAVAAYLRTIPPLKSVPRKPEAAKH
jgi:mono/diheme cytochrome c family protein